jgi:hypothetical protein
MPQGAFPVTQPPAARRRLEWWHYAALLLIAVQAALCAGLQTRPGAAGVVFWYLASDVLLWWGLTLLVAIAAAITAIVRRPILTRWRAMGGLLLALLVALPLAYRSYPSSHDERPSEIRFRLPLDGPITVGWGGATADVNYHVIAPEQRWAYDLLVTKNGQSFSGSGERLEDYHCYGQPVLAPAGGTVRAVFGDARDMPPGQLGGTPKGGNQIVLEVAPRQFLFLCHLQPGSIAVRPGEQVAQGQAVARVGNSGNTSEPHLHIHLQDTLDDDFGEGIPLYFSGYKLGPRLIDRGLPTGGIQRGQFVGQIVEHAADAPPRPD